MYTLKQIPSEAQIRKFLRRTLFGKNVFCPSCRSRRIEKQQERYRCRTCRIRFSLTSHTWLSNLKLPLEQWWVLLWCWTIQEPVRQAVTLSGLPERTVRRWYATFRLHLPQETHVLERIVQMDEAYFKNAALVMAKQKGTRKLAFEVFHGRYPTKTDAVSFLFEHVAPGSELWTDGGSIYKNISQRWPVSHQRDIHSKFEFEHTSEIEGMFGVYRTFVRRMYHHHWSENLEEYVREFCFRFSSPEIFNSPRIYLTKSLTLVPTCS
ncbi:MAG: IS1595 family transposase [bacterium]